MSDAGIRLPETWDDQSIYMLVGNPRGEFGFSANISVARYKSDKPMLLETVVKESPISDALDSLLVLKKGFESCDGVQYFERTYRFVEPYESELLQQCQRFVLVGGKPFVITYTNVAKAYAEDAEVLELVFKALTKGA